MKDTSTSCSWNRTADYSPCRPALALLALAAAVGLSSCPSMGGHPPSPYETPPSPYETSTASKVCVFKGCKCKACRGKECQCGAKE